MKSRSPNFNAVARPYRWLEYFTFGPFLERCRFAQLEKLGAMQHAVILGDGDGRFLERLLHQHPALSADVIDLSSSMLRLAEQRVELNRRRVNFYLADIRTFPFSADPIENKYDLVAAHFFLDCLNDAEVADLIQRLKPTLATDAAFIVSEFAIPPREPLQSAARLLVGSLYFTFRLLTGLENRKLPAYDPALRAAGFEREDVQLFLGGILRSERWRLRR